ncbi:signal-regulatory protein beta-2-like [Archocentrus centrarchus]|uniref:signal-regulatory protein beta-2-like n=1 Tax=Archocentrus centrarchus TaxID=63155 RepID=UPI0011E9FFAF|nr:signal-regulatory protein beta-2-like [Archocentrus centrarchus]
MIRRLLSLILLSTVSLIEMNEVPHQISLNEAKIGDDINLTCTILSDDAGLSYWYKLNFGYMLETVAKGAFGKLTLKGQFDNSRFSATKVGNVHSLTIRNISKEDEATYLCQAGSAYEMEFITGTVLSVKDPKTQQKSVTVKQTPNVELVHLNDTMTLQCSLLAKNNKNDTVECPGEDKVHWFKGASESHPGIVYHGSIREREEGRCEYTVSKNKTTSSDAGTYYCAVVTCGEILFGEGTKVEIKGFPVVAVLVTLLICSVLVNFALILTRKQKPACEHCKAQVTASNQSPINQPERSATEQLSNVEREEAAVNYVVLDFPTRKPKRWKNKRELLDEHMHYGERLPVNKSTLR